MTFGRLTRFRRHRRGSVAIITALLIPVLLGMGGLVAEYGDGLLAKVENQRVADLAAFAGALAYNTSGTTAAMSSAADAVASLNGVPASGVSANLVSSPTGDGNQAVEVSVSTQHGLLLAPVLGGGAQLTASANAYAELKPSTSGCIIALKTGGSGVTLSGGTAVTASGCAVSSNAAVTAPCGTSIKTTEVDYDTSVSQCTTPNAITTPSGSGSVKMVQAITADPLSGNSEVATATSRLTTVNALGAPTAPSVSGGQAMSFGWGSPPPVPSGCSTPTFSSSTWTLTCASGGNYTFGTISVGGGLTVNFNTGGSASTTYNFNGAITNTGGGSTLNFGPGTYNVTQGITNSGVISFGAGAFSVGRSTSACSGAGQYSLCNTGSTFTVAGPSSFSLTAGVYNAGGSKMTLGSGSTNSFAIGPSSDGNAVYLGGGSTTIFADATSGSTSFQLDGNFNAASGGGSCVSLSAAAQHDIRGYFSTAGGNVLGSGTYTVAGYVAFGPNGGGDVTCGGSTVGVSGANVTFVIGASSTLSSGTCANMGFCVASGYGHVTLTGPSSGTLSGLVVVGPTGGGNSAGASFAEGASGVSLSGAFYFPNGPISLSGGSSVGAGSGQCLEFVGSQVTLSGGTALASACLAGAASSGVALLVQ